ncbi:MAG: acetyl/propionyl/methylcrotonyl-CoA carboxylase subunit alpha [Thermoplasmata archaeon]
MMMFNRILVANRGEIAIRVMRTCKEMGIETVSVFSDADKNALHTRFSDLSYNIGPAPASQSYLDQDKIIDVAQEAGAEAIHPGYGFLAENPMFAEKCERAGIIFIGPTSKALAKSGDKVESRRIVKRAGIPVTPGSDESVRSESEAIRIAEEIGYPIILKASAGGGGISMAVVRSTEELPSSLKVAKSSSLSSFGSDEIFVEKYLEPARHIEFQILADSDGNVIHLGERECSVQRRFQKLIEESPSPIVDRRTRRRVGQLAVRAAVATEYLNAGTIEFLYHEGKFYFNEINARLQVEHPVTEFVTGIDLVRQQVKIAGGEGLQYTQRDIAFRGWSIECRINAESPFENFMPSPGTIESYSIPGSIGVRVDSGVEAGSEVSTYYDPLLAKVIVWAGSRDKAVRRMRRALSEMKIEGIETNIPFHLELLRNDDFMNGDIHTGLVEESGIIELLRGEGKRRALEEKLAVAAVAVFLSEQPEEMRYFTKRELRVMDFERLSPWARAGRLERLRKRLNADEIQSRV